MKIEYKIDTEKYMEALAKYPTLLFRNLRTALGGIGQDFLGKFIKQRLSGRPGLNRQPGAPLARSFFKKVEGGILPGASGFVQNDNGETLHLAIATSSKYAAIHEYGSEGLPGGVIKGRRGQRLAIPILDNLTPTGGVRRPWKPFDSTLHYGGLSKAGNPLIRGQDGSIFFALVKSVRIPARMGLRKLWQDNRPGFINDLNYAVQQTLLQANFKTKFQKVQ
jgi:hypothetical protein